jgi:hypothetical protein
MNKKIGLYIILGLIVGANFGIFFGPVLGNTSLAIALGALGSVFIGWFISAAVLENSKNKDKTNDQ